MKIIALFFPALLSVSVYFRRQPAKLKPDLYLMTRYGIYTMLVNWCAMSLITYIFQTKVVISDMESSGFFTKYVFIAVFFAGLIPYMEEIIKKYVCIRFHIESKVESK